ncbi:hypothetical protein TBR22_A26900 [Luteitalea sp. TBR-22]|uniref:LiaF transmembrane domain-containing protein n=1 Tax=Luteitalea sp. TBR-22 TaxID=2802971 RepID=UPI001AF37AE7|nr:hypothetical protein [Luteitalea sp. TBR-22]BCS33463.1 hypothetical protein TBR22_A26900 [Luteitalea sp. TBR-22]
MSRHECRSTRGQTIVTGLMFLMSGVALLGVMRGWWVVERYWDYWPLVFVFPAINKLMGPPPERHLVAGLAWLGLAVALLGRNLGWVHWQARTAAPVLLVVAGSRLIYLAVTRNRSLR